MRNILLLLAVWLSATFAAQAQTAPNITLTTDLAVGSTITMVVKTPAAATIKVDFGNGTLVDKAIATAGTTITGALVGSQTLKVYGATMTYFDCKSSQVTALDLSNATTLTTLFCGNNKLTSLDVTMLTKLTDLQCYVNQLTSLDVTKNTALKMLDAENNLFTALDISKNTALAQLFVRKNFLTLANLPLPTSKTWTNYYYAPQKPLAIADSITLDDTVNLASQATAGTSATVYTWKTKAGTVLVAGTDYTITAGKTVFLKPQTDSVYCELTNTAFPNFTGTDVLKTNFVAVYDILPTITFTTEKAIGTEISFTLAATQANTIVKVDFGNGVKIEKTIGTTETTITGTIVGSQNLKIYGDTITKLTCPYIQLTALDVSNCSKLTQLHLFDNKLTTLDISKNTKLQELNVEKNSFTSLDISNNSLLKYLSCSYNLLETVDISKNLELYLLDALHNKIASIDVTKNTKLGNLNLFDNRLTAIDISNNPKILNLDLRDNYFTFASLPLNLTKFSYNYSSQNKIGIPTNILIETPFDLSAQYSIGGNTTVYAWKTKSGITLVEGTDYTIAEGKTTFLKGQTDSVYCEMTNATFPNLSGADALKTTNAAVIAPAITMTTKMAVGKMITLNFTAFKDNTFISIDFGNGTLETYAINVSGTNVSGTIGATQTIKIYGGNIRSLDCSNLQLTALDISNCTSLLALSCSNNELTVLDISKNKNIDYLLCKNNMLTFASLPFADTYEPQKPISIADSTSQSDIVDLSSQKLVNTTSTVYTWKTKAGVTLVAGTDYSIVEGKTTFLKSQTDSVYCEMTNTMFPRLSGTNALKTTLTKVAGKPKQTQTIAFTGLPYQLVIGKTYQLSATASSKQPVTFSSSNDALASISGSTLTVKHSGTFSITATQVGNDTLAAIDSVQTRVVDMPLLMTLVQTKTATSKFYVTYKATQIVPNANTIRVLFNRTNEMNANYTDGWFETGEGKNDTISIYSDFVTEISCTKNALTSVKIEPNTCLETLILADNALAVLDASNCSNLLSLQCSGNQLKTLDLSRLQKLTDLRCSRNMLETLDLSANPLLTHINAESNKLTSINITSCPVLNKLYLYQNKLTTLDVSANPKLGVLGCHYNNLNIATLPLKTSNLTQYEFWPQADIQLPLSVGVNQTIDLSSQSTRNGVTTTYTWKTKAGATLVAGTDYTITDGKTTFIKSLSDSVYCEMTNATFSVIDDSYLLKTNCLLVLEKALATQTIDFPALPATLEFGKTYELSATASSKLPVSFTTSNDALASISGSTLTVKHSGTFSITATQAGNDTLLAIESVQTFTVAKPLLMTLVQTKTATSKFYVTFEAVRYSTDQTSSIATVQSNSFQPMDVTWTDGNFSSTAGTADTLRIYSDCITKLICSYNALTSVKIEPNNSLKELGLYHNTITSLDLNESKNLENLFVSDNVISTLNVSGCLNIKELHCYSNKITTLDLTNNTALNLLRCEHNLLSTLKLPSTDSLTYLQCNGNQLTTLDLTNNTVLNVLHCEDNLLSILKLPLSESLTNVQCSYNQLTTLDISNLTNLTELNCDKNMFRFSTLPIKQSEWTSYVYLNQAAISIPETIVLGEIVDLSSEYNINGNITTYRWDDDSGVTLVEGVDYTISEGKTTFSKIREGYTVRCLMTNATFPNLSGQYVLRTTFVKVLDKALATQTISFPALPATLEFGKTYELSATASSKLPVTFSSSDESIASISGSTLTIKRVGNVTITATQAGNDTLAAASAPQSVTTTVGEPNIVMTTGKAVGADFTFEIDATIEYSVIYVDFGNGVVEFSNKNTYATVSDKVTNMKTIKVYGSNLNTLYCDSQNITDLQLTNCPEMVDLRCSSNSFTQLDVSQNNKLISLSCNYNRNLKTLLLNNPELHDLSCGECNLTTLDVTNCYQLMKLRFNGNNISSLDLSKNAKLESINCWGNELTRLDVSNNKELGSLICSVNKLSSLDLSNNSKLTTLWCTFNSFSFSSFPLLQSTWTNLNYAPQDTLPISKDIAVGSVLDLSSEYSVGGNTTVYTWISTKGDTLVAGTDYTIAEGKTTFLRTRTDSVFCAMTNATFPDFKGENALKTTAIRILDKQSVTFAALPSAPAIGASIQLSATASTGAAVTFTSSNPSVASITGTTLTIHKAGTVTITATVAGTNTLASATETQTLTIAPVTALSTAERSECVLYPTVATDCINLSGAAASIPAKVRVFNAQGVLVLEGSLQDGSLDVSALPAGQYLLKTNATDDKHTHRFVKQ